MHAPALALSQLLAGYVRGQQTPHHQTPLTLTRDHLLDSPGAEGALEHPLLMRACRRVNAQTLADVTHTLAESVHARI